MYLVSFIQIFLKTISLENPKTLSFYSLTLDPIYNDSGVPERLLMSEVQ